MKIQLILYFYKGLNSSAYKYCLTIQRGDSIEKNKGQIRVTAALAILIAALMVLSTFVVVAPIVEKASAAANPNEEFRGYNLEQNKWTTGNLGKAYYEGDFVSYQLWIGQGSKIWEIIGPHILGIQTLRKNILPMYTFTLPLL